MMSPLALDIYLDYLLHKEHLRNLFTLYYRREAVVAEETRCFMPTPLQLGHVEVSAEDAQTMGFFDWVGVIVRCALYLREDISRRVASFVADEIRDERCLQQAIDIELNEKAKQEALVSREGCLTRLMAWDRQALASLIDKPEADVPMTFEAIYALLIRQQDDADGESDRDESSEGGGLPDGVMMPMGVGGEGDSLECPSDVGGSAIPGMAASPDQEEDVMPSDEGGGDEDPEGDEEVPDTEPASGDETPTEANDPQGDGEPQGVFVPLSGMTEQAAVECPDDVEREPLLPGQGFSLNLAGSSSTFVKQTDTALEALVEILIKTATGESGKERKGTQKVRWKTHWAGYHRQLSHVQEMLGDDVILPPKRRRKDPPRGKGKFKLCVYLDTSYSCTQEARRFFSLVTNMSPARFEIALHSFSDGVKTHDVEAGEFRYRTGGTNIHAVLSHAKGLDAEKVFDAVVVLTDGEFADVRRDSRIQRPEKWHWVLIPRHYRDAKTMPETSYFYDLPRR